MRIGKPWKIDTFPDAPRKFPEQYDTIFTKRQAFIVTIHEIRIDFYRIFFEKYFFRANRGILTSPFQVFNMHTLVRNIMPLPRGTHGATRLTI
jgi:hypothetical protein